MVGYSLNFFHSKEPWCNDQYGSKYLKYFKLYSESDIIKSTLFRRKRLQIQALKEAESIAKSILCCYLKISEAELNSTEKIICNVIDIFLNCMKLLEEKNFSENLDFQQFLEKVFDITHNEVSWTSVCILFGMGVYCALNAERNQLQVNQYASYIKQYLTKNTQLLNFVIKQGGWENVFDRRSFQDVEVDNLLRNAKELSLYLSFNLIREIL